MKRLSVSFVTPACAQFFAHWKALCGTNLAPHTEAFLDASPCHLMPSVCLAEVTAGGLLLRFVGTEISKQWGHDFTGSYWEERVAREHRSDFRRDIQRVCTHPAGLRALGETQTSAGRTLRYEAIYLPLTVNPTKPSRCLRFSQVSAELERHERKLAFDWTAAPAWIDIGAGVPD